MRREGERREKREEKEIFLIVLSSDFSNNLKRNAFK